MLGRPGPLWDDPRVRTTALLLLLLTVSAPVLAEEVVVYSAHGADIQQEFTDAFEKSRPDVRVRWLDMGAAVILERLRAEKSRPAAHVWWGAPSTAFAVAGREGLLEPYRPTWADLVPDYARGDDDLWFGQFDFPIGIGYVPGRIPEDRLPRRWDDLLDPDAPGRFVLRDPPASGTMRTFFAAMVLRQASVEQGFAWLARLNERTRSYTASPNLLFERMSRGEGDLTVWGVTDLLFQKARHDFPFAVILPDEGVPVITDSIALVKGAGPAARAFYEFVTSVESNLSLAAGHYRIPLRSDLPTERRPEWLKDFTYHALPLDRARIAAEGEAWMARWETEIRSAGDAGGFDLAVIAIGVVLGAAAVLLVTRLRRRSHEDV
jgi:iron(III) transport system substrate-binding protein